MTSVCWNFSPEQESFCCTPCYPSDGFVTNITVTNKCNSQTVIKIMQTKPRSYWHHDEALTTCYWDDFTPSAPPGPVIHMDPYTTKLFSLPSQSLYEIVFVPLQDSSREAERITLSPNQRPPSEYTVCA